MCRRHGKLLRARAMQERIEMRAQKYRQIRGTAPLAFIGAGGGSMVVVAKRRRCGARSGALKPSG